MSFNFNSCTKVFILMLSSLAILSGCQFGTNSDNIYGYDFQTAKITYKITGYSEGSSVVLIKGNKKVITNDISQKTPDGGSKPSHNITIINGDRFYSLNPEKKTGSSIKNPLYTEMLGLSQEKRAAKLLQEATHTDTDAELPKPEKQEDIQGQKCNLYSTGPSTKSCLWLDIPLRSVTSLPENGIQVDSIATKIELNQPIADSEFDVPGDYQITKIN